jgi:Eco57I restriction-modification methylase/restriction endonuclease TaqI-like protein/type I restriction and modification enzyme subunit R-like protein
MEARPIIASLVRRYEEHRDRYRAPDYKEARLRQEFLDPFLSALGWDVGNTNGYSEAFKEVVVEDSLIVQGVTRAPDYAIRVGGQTQYFVEAKKPYTDLKNDPEPALQLRRYAWTKKLAISVLSDFEELAVYDTRVPPTAKDEARKARIHYWTVDQYLGKWDEIANLLSKEAILHGSIEKFIAGRGSRTGTAEVDDRFLADIERWRVLLARDVHKRRPDLSTRELNFAIQRTIDRIVFLRICEDRGIEPFGRLKAAVSGKAVYSRLLDIFKDADNRYNSGLFHFRKEKGRAETPDDLTPSLGIDDKILREIVSGLYPPASPYAFDVFPADILGSVYERFLGNAVTISGKRVSVEEKTEVRKAGGVYYTPAFVVDYIVRETLSPQLSGRSVKQITDVRVLDPACGSGSFLIHAYQFLLDWYLDRYTSAEPAALAAKRNPVIRATRNGGWQLTTSERKQILLRHIFGVDLDAQAVEVTKLSLLLKVLEGETAETMSAQLKLLHERALPDLGDNIKNGNSLVAPDYYSMGLGLEGEETHFTVNPFSWENEFSIAMSGGGFDAVIGNPPYIRSRHIDAETKRYFRDHYDAGAYQPDTFAFFMERGVKLLRAGGELGFILPNGLLTNTYYEPLRRYLLDKTALRVIVDLKDGVFAASVDTSIIITRKRKPRERIGQNMVAIGESPARESRVVQQPKNVVAQSAFYSLPDLAFNTRMDSTSIEITAKIAAAGVPMGSVIDVKAGMKVRKEFVDDHRRDKRYQRFLRGSDITPYLISWGGAWVCYDRSLEAKFTNQAFRDEAIFKAPAKILVRQVMGPSRIYAAVDREEYYVDQSLYVLLPTADLVPEYVQAIISSRVMAYYFSRTLADGKETFPKVKGAQLEQLPIVPPNRSSRDSEIGVRIVGILVERSRIQALLSGARHAAARTALERQLDATDGALQLQIYELYGLTPDEVAIIERTRV